MTTVTTRARTRAGAGRTDVVLLQTAVGDYRSEFLDQVQRRLPGGLRVVTGPDYFDQSLRTRISGDHVTMVRNRFLFGRRVLVQSPAAVAAALRAGTLVCELNPRIATTWLLLAARRLLGRRTVVWGHAFARSGPTARSNALRRLMMRLAGEVMLYTYRQAEELRPMRGVRTYVVPNAVHRRTTPAAGPRRDVLYCGRLAAAKRPEHLLEAFALARPHLPPSTRLHVVGDGPLRDTLAQTADRLGIGDVVVFHGQVADESRLRELYGAALVALSPGYVGLALTQSLAFGVPMLIARDQPHAPEVELATTANTRFADPSASALAQSLVQFFTERDAWLRRTEEISAAAQRLYSVETMAAGFVGAIRGR